jgi:hypothetical protein
LAYGLRTNLHQRISPFLEKINIDLLSVTESIEYIKETVIKQSDHGFKTNNQIIKLVQYQVLNTFSQNRGEERTFDDLCKHFIST